jgi:hypothetical protein
MADEIPESMPDMPEPPRAPDGWELACLGIVRSKFGRGQSRALSKAMMQLSAEKAWLEARAEAAQTSWWERIRETFTARPGLGWALAVAVLLIMGRLSWSLFSHGQEPNRNLRAVASGCRIADAVNARWGGNNAALKPGDTLPAGPLRLESGVVELAFASGAKAAVQGPAEWKLSEPNGIELRQGKLSAEVPPPAVGFTVRTPNATVIDLGTRFGIDAKSRDSSEVDVFEGKVQVTEARAAKEPNNEWDLTRNMAMVLDNRGGVTAAAAAETAFPQPSHAILIRPANCGFDSPGATRIGGFPADFGFWSGPAFQLTGPVAGVRTVQGAGMLRFFSPPRQGGKAVDSVVWQLVDLHPAKDFMARNGTVDLKAWVQFNRIPGGAGTASKFALTIAAFRGQAADAPALWAARSRTAVATAEKELVADNDPWTWERVDVATTVTADADFAVLEIRAIAPPDAPAGLDPFPGHFADLIDAKVCLPLRASSTAAAR